MLHCEDTQNAVSVDGSDKTIASEGTHAPGQVWCHIDVATRSDVVMMKEFLLELCT
jgi:hypothetical protein